MEIVSVRFQDKRNKSEFTGKEYSYFAAITLKVGDIVSVPTRSGSGVAKVTRLDVNPDSVGCALELLKTIKTLAEAEPTDTDQMAVSEAAGQVPGPTF